MILLAGSVVIIFAQFLKISSDMRQAKQTFLALVQREATQLATAFCLFFGLPQLRTGLRQVSEVPQMKKQSCRPDKGRVTSQP